MSLPDLPHEKPAPDALQALLTVREVARVLKISVRSVWRLVASRKLPAPLKVGGVSRWQRTDIARWIESGCPAVAESEAGESPKEMIPGTDHATIQEDASSSPMRRGERA
jgi:excisionase family DNA binding protein